MTDIAEPAFTQAFIAKASVVTLNTFILCRLAGWRWGGRSVTSPFRRRLRFTPRPLRG